MNKTIPLLFILVVVLAPLTSAQVSTCLIADLSLACSILNCDISTLINFFCAGISLPLVEISPTVTGAATINFNDNLSLYGLSISSSASSSLVINLNQELSIAHALIVSGNSLVKVAAGALVSVAENITVAAQASIQVAGNLTVQGAAYVQGTIQLAGQIAQNATQTAWLVASQVSFSGTASAAAQLRGNGGIDGTVSCSGNVSLSAGNSPGVIYVNGDLDMGATTTLEVDVDSALNYDLYFITGEFNRDGILYVNFENGYVPSSDTSFTFATHSSSSGSFNIYHGNYDSTFDKISPSYGTLSTKFVYGSALALAAPIVFIVIMCVSTLLLL